MHFLWQIRLQKDGSDDSTHSSERLGIPVKGEEEYVHIKGESTESELDEEEEDEDSVQLREGDEEEREGYKVCVCIFCHHKIPSIHTRF